jgi:uncharacterized repeat protein (TIGR01451 family)
VGGVQGRRRQLIRRRMLALSVVFGLSLAGTAFSAAGQWAEAEPSDRVTGENCREVFAFPDADPDTVREVARIPKDWKLQGVEQQGDRATLAVVMLSCERVNVAGRSRPLIYTTLSVAIDPPERVADRSTSSFGGVPGETDFYLISWATNDSDFASWMEEDTGLHQVVHYVPSLEFTYDASLGGVAEFTFRADAPTPSPFQLSALVTEPVAPMYPLVANFWAETSAGAVMIETSYASPGSQLGSSQWELHAEPSSPLARMMERDEATGFNEIGSEFGTRAEWRKDLPRNCTPAERHAELRDEQAVMLDLVSHYGPGEGQDLTTLNGPEDMVALAQGDPESGTIYSFYDHAFVSFEGMGMAIFNTGDNGADPADHTRRRTGKPDLLLYAPDPNAADATDPYGPDFPYELAGWAYSPPYDYSQHPTFLGDCITRADWFVHERSIHPADTWGTFAVPPDESVHGEHPGQDPILPTECDDPLTITAELCPEGFQHPRIWDIHLWPGNDAASVSMLSPSPIAGIDPEVGKAFFYPESRTADLALDKTDSLSRVPTGRDLTYLVTVNNNGPHNALAVQVTDMLPPSVTFVSAMPSQGSCEESGGTVTCRLGTVQNLSGATIEIVVTPQSAGRITNTASVSSTAFDPIPENNTDSEETSVCRSTSRRISIPCG